MEIHFERLSKNNLSLIRNFSCDTDTSSYNSKDRRRIKKRDKELSDFLIKEAFKEQEKMFNTTHLLINERNELVGFVSLCNDSLSLAEDSQNKYETIYCTVPALKIARLGVSSKYQHNGYGRMLLEYALFKAVDILGYSGVAFITLDCYKHRESFYLKNGFDYTDIQPQRRSYDTPISMCKHIITWLIEFQQKYQ